MRKAGELPALNAERLPNEFTEPAQGSTRRRNSLCDHAALQRFGTLAMCIVLVVAVTAMNRAFLSSMNIANMLSQWAPAGIMAVGMTGVVIAGGFDLSIASTYSLCAVIAALVGQHLDPGWAFAAAALAGAAAGACNGALIVSLNINPYIATVGSGFVISGVSLVLTQNTAVIVSTEAFGVLGAGRWHGVPLSGLLFLALAAIAGLILKYTVPGHMVYAIGGNPEASKLSGLPVSGVCYASYSILGVCCGIAGFLSASQLNSAQSSSDSSILFDVVTIVILGGNSFGGGVGSMWQTLVGLVMVASISNGFVLLDINPFYQSLFKGAIIIAALAFDSLLKGALSHRSHR